jgi:hypothetical protein
MVEAISYCNEIVVAINGIIATKISLQYVIFIATTNFVAKPITTEFIATAKTYYHGFYCNGKNLLPRILLQRLATTNFRCDKSLLQQNESFCSTNPKILIIKQLRP